MFHDRLAGFANPLKKSVIGFAPPCTTKKYENINAKVRNDQSESVEATV